MFRRVSLQLFTLAVVLLASGCAHRFATVKLDDDLRIAKNAQRDVKGFDGILVARPTLKKFTYKTTVATNAQGLVVATEGGSPACLPQEKIEFKTMPDYGTMYGLLYKPGFFASGSITFSLKDGMLTSVNAASDPEIAETINALANLSASAAKAMAPVPTAAPAVAGQYLCNASPKLLSITDY